MGQDQGPYGDSGGFTPYQPDATPDAEPGDAGAPPPFVPYGTAQGMPNVPNVPYGGAPNVPYGGSASIGTPFVITASSGPRWVGWVVGIGIVALTCGGSAIGILAGLFDNDPSTTTTGTSPDYEVPPIEIPSFEIPSFEVPSIPGPVFANDLKRDQCLIGVGFQPGSTQGISNLEVTECAGAHNAQVLEVRVLSGREASEYDFSDQDQGNRSCFPLFSPAQKELFRGDEYTLLSFTETANPAQGDKVACLVVRTDGALYRGFLPRD